MPLLRRRRMCLPALALAGLLLPLACAAAARLDPQLAAATAPRIPVVLTFHGDGPPDAGNRAVLEQHGVSGTLLRSLPMAAFEASPEQLRALAGHPQVRSVWHDRIDATPQRGAAPDAASDAEGWSGRGVGVLVASPAADASAAGLERIAPGAEVIGFRTGSGHSVSAALGAFDYALGHQFDYNLRVVWNELALLDEVARSDPDHPLQVALRALAERGVLVVVPAPSGSKGRSIPWAIASTGPQGGSAPAVCGVLALMLEANPALTWREARGILRRQPLHGALDSVAAVAAAAGGLAGGGASRAGAGPLSALGNERR